MLSSASDTFTGSEDFKGALTKNTDSEKTHICVGIIVLHTI